MEGTGTLVYFLYQVLTGTFALAFLGPAEAAFVMIANVIFGLQWEFENWKFKGWHGEPEE